MLGSLVEVVRGLAGLIYPNACLLCDVPETESAPIRHGLCMSCFSAITTDAASVCPKCAATVGPHTDLSDGCFACRPRSFAFEEAVRLGPYSGKLQEAIVRIKFSPGEPLAERLGLVFAQERVTWLNGKGIERVVPVPLHWKRRWTRGFNQAATLAREVAKALNVEFRPGTLRRIKAASQHAQPSATARQENIRGAFVCSPRASLKSRIVLLIDDVMTTGSTVGEAARVLKAAGAAKVYVAVLARA